MTAIPCTLYASLTDTTPHPLSDAVAVLSSEPSRSPAKGGWLWAPHVLVPGGTRANEHVAHVTALVYDCDDAPAPRTLGLAGWVHPTHTPGRERLILRISRPMAPAEHARVWLAMHPTDVDPSAKDAARAYYLPPPGAPLWVLAGPVLDVDAVLATAPTLTPETFDLSAGPGVAFTTVPLGEAAVAALVAAYPARGKRHHYRLAVAGACLHAGLAQTLAYALLLDATRRVSGDEHDVREAVQDTYAAVRPLIKAGTLVHVYGAGVAVRALEAIGQPPTMPLLELPDPRHADEPEPAPAQGPWDILTGPLIGAPSQVEAALLAWRGVDPQRLPKPPLKHSKACCDWLRSIGVPQAELDRHFGKPAEKVRPARQQVDQPVVLCHGRPQCEVNDETATHMRQRCFTRAGKIVRINHETADIVPQTSAVLMVHLASKHLRFEQLDTKGDPFISDVLPGDLAAYLAAETHDGAKPLHGVLRTPTVRSDGSVWADCSYHDGLQMWRPHAYEPTACADALAVLLEPLAEFPYDEACGPAVALAAVLTLLVRPTLWQASCAVPAFALDGPDGGVGKSLLGAVIAGCAGAELQSIAWSDDEAELMKRVDASLFAGHQALHFDNARTGVAFGTPALDAYLTATRTVQSRVLGESTIRRVPWLCTAIVTGNQMSFAGESRRRFLRVRLAARAQRYTRSSEALKAYVQANRTRLLNAGLSLMSAHLTCADGWAGTRTIASYEGWCETVAACVERFTGVNPIASQDSTADLANGAGEQAEALEALKTFMAEPVSIDRLALLAGMQLLALHRAVFPSWREPGREALNAQRFATLFGRLRDRPLGALKLVRASDRPRLWQVVPATALWDVEAKRWAWATEPA